MFDVGKLFDFTTLEVGTTVTDREGSEYRILATDRPDNDYPIVVMRLHDGTVDNRTKYGMVNACQNQRHGLVPPRLVRWLNIYHRGVTGDLHETRDEAVKEMRYRHEPIACIKIEFTQGEGL